MGNIWIGPWANFPQYMDRTLLDELGWNSLEDRRKLARLTLFKKMIISTQAHKENRPNDTLVPEYLHSLVPHTVGDRAWYVLRNAGKLDTIKTRLVASYNSFIPKTVREWNTLMSTDNIYNSNIQKALTIESLKLVTKGSSFGPLTPCIRLKMSMVTCIKLDLDWASVTLELTYSSII